MAYIQQFNPYLQHSELIEFHKQNKIVTVAYSPLIPITKAPNGPVDNYIETLAGRYGVTPAEILLRWCIDQRVVVVTTSSQFDRMRDYRRCCTFSLAPTEVHQIGELGDKKPFRFFWRGKFDEGNFE